MCTGLGCYLQGGARILESVSGDLGIGVGETTDDGAITLEETPCLFVCAMAPAMELGGGPFGRLTPDDAVTRLQAIPPIPPTPAMIYSELKSKADREAQARFAKGPRPAWRMHANCRGGGGACNCFRPRWPRKA